MSDGAGGPGDTPGRTSRVTPQWPEIMCLGSLPIMLRHIVGTAGSVATHTDTHAHTTYTTLFDFNANEPGLDQFPMSDQGPRSGA